MLSRIRSFECGRSYLDSEKCPRAKLGIAVQYNRVSFCSLIGHFSILLNPCRNDIMLPAEWLNWTEREIIAVVKLARENGKCISDQVVFIGNNLPKSREDTDIKLSRTKEASEGFRTAISSNWTEKFLTQLIRRKN